MALDRPIVVAAFAVSLTAIAPAYAGGAASTSVVDVPTRGVTQRFLYVRPDAPIANIVFLAGRDGAVGIENDGSIPTIIGRCTPFSRNRDALAARGLAIALVDRTSDGKVRQFADVYEVARYMQDRDKVPTWIVGGSGSTRGALRFAAEFPLDEPLGVIIFSPYNPDLAAAALVKGPTLIIYHRDDPGAVAPPMKERVDALFDSLTAAPVKERISLAGGIDMDECGGYHLFRGLDAWFVDEVAGFVEKHNPARH
jgi:hypothetical protein